ncbi:hypothetical protein P7F88_07965 [Vibrio hannami]|uniref:hypothetical protein n=1 Tax=Vibrio hannami TaxID=2717094 RepID=UPI002410326D|nr:hypothetical protein [Vibrio hannami]MDG3086033.1 hypothetical protein [Vibrio hannami]
MKSHLFTPIVLLTSSVVLTGCSSKPVEPNTQILRHSKVVTHDYYYINVSDPASLFIMEDIVGGEHENHYQVLGFFGDEFLINFESTDDSFSYGIGGDGFEFRNTPDGNLVTIVDETTWVDVFTWSYPETSRYSLKIQKLSE